MVCAAKIPVIGGGLGPLEAKVMEMVWNGGRGSVRDVMARLGGHRYAYTTVMTTLNRLCAKGLLDRELSADRAFIYTPRYGREEWDKASVAQFLEAYVGRSPRRVGLLISALIDAADGEDPLLDELERKINYKRAELKVREKS